MKVAQKRKEKNTGLERHAGLGWLGRVERGWWEGVMYFSTYTSPPSMERKFVQGIEIE